MLSLLGRTWPMWWAVVMMFGLRRHYLLVARSQPDELLEVAYEAEERCRILPERTGNMR
jgi:hypothetical protein